MIEKTKSNYCDLVICTNKEDSSTHMFRTPAWSGLKKGDDVIVETTEIMQVENIYTFDMNDERLEFFLMCAGAEFPLQKIIYRIDYKKFVYADEDSEDEKRGYDL